MQEDNEYTRIIRSFYEKSLILESPSDFHPVLHFYFMDALAHIDFSLNILAYNIQSPRNLMNMEYMRWRVDEEKMGDRAHFPAFINWLREEHPETFLSLPMVWQLAYDRNSAGGYRSFRIVIDPDDRNPLPPRFFRDAIEEFFDQSFIKSIYQGNSLARLFDSFMAQNSS
ncbi:MAG: hypothetical protein ACP5C4_07010 [Methanomicrobiales archaeon]